MTIPMLLGTGFVIVAIIQTVEFFRLTTTLQKEFPQVWTQLGSPDLSSPNGQVAIANFILGRRRQMPYPSEFVASSCKRLRFYFAVNLCLFVPFTVLAITGGG